MTASALTTSYAEIPGFEFTTATTGPTTRSLIRLRDRACSNAYAFTVFENAFKEYGMSNAIRTDNGVPFASPNALFNLSKLSVWWLRLGIEIERIKPGNPQQNGRHERMHLTLIEPTIGDAWQVDAVNCMT